MHFEYRFMESVTKNTIIIRFLINLCFLFVCWQPTPMSTFFQGYLGAVSSAVTIAVSSHVYYTKLYYVIWCVERIVFWILNFELPFYANRDYIHDFSSTVNLILISNLKKPNSITQAHRALCCIWLCWIAYPCSHAHVSSRAN